MSEQERDRKFENEGDTPEDVEAHKLANAGDEGEAEGDDVEAHQHSHRGQHAGRGAADEGGDDDVDAHMHGVRGS